MLHSYNAINASAGSGKTYTLVQRILMLCLRYPHQQDAIRHILALTFTNKAANEMKARILDWLKEFTKSDYADNNELKGIREELKKQGINVTLEDLHERSQKVLDYILHHYSTLNIGTIDRFNSKLVRSFSYELGLSNQFNLEIQSEPFLIEAVDKMLESIGGDNQISEAFMDFVNYNLENDERINLNRTLYRKSKQLNNDIHYEELKSNAEFDWEAYETAKTNLRKSIAEHRSFGRKIAENSLELINGNGLSEADFQGKSNSIAAFFRKYLDFENGIIEKFPFPSDEEKAMLSYRKGTTSKDISVQNAVFGILDTLIDNRYQIISHYIESEKKAKILSELLPLKINKEIQEKLGEIEDENDLVLLSKFNIIINENLKNEPSAFIYEKVGTRFQHYFFDEFQDTSKMQWQNFLPLKEHTINSEGHTFTLVGDPKQSIYRFRGGDSDLMIEILNRKEETNVPVNIEVLGKNYRSAQHLVEFNNELYDYLANNLNPEHQELFREKAKQEPVKKTLGRVKVNLTDYTRSIAPFYESIGEQMHNDIQECLDNGFGFSDITILCRTGDEIQKLAQILGNKSVDYNGNTTHIKTISEKGLTLDLSYTLRALIEFFRWEIQPKNKQFLVKMLYYLNQLGRITFNDFSKEILDILKLESKDSITDYISEKHNLSLKIKEDTILNLYSYIEHYTEIFFKENKELDFILNFLEATYNFTQNAGANLKDFVNYWDEEAHKLSVQASENIDAITLMTIHAAKGLEFPVVFLPMKNYNKDSDFSEWYALEGYDELKSINLSGFQKTWASYDEQLSEFNETNTYKNKIDRFCINYVATTRPVEQLFFYLQKPSSENSSKNEIYDFIKTKNTTEDASFDLFPEADLSFRKQKKQDTAKRNTMEILGWSKPVESSSIKIATPSKNYQNTVEKVRIGIFTHEILSKINSENDIEKTLEHYVLEGLLTPHEKVEIGTKILQIIKEYPQYFSNGLKIINEKDIMLTENNTTQIYRPDRLIETDKGFYIIDFKTGEPKEVHQKQLDAYQSVLEKLGRTVVETQLIYI